VLLADLRNRDEFVCIRKFAGCNGEDFIFQGGLNDLSFTFEKSGNAGVLVLIIVKSDTEPIIK
jgi:hypothetical protein